jgi:thioester reductase-like protein
VNGALLLTGGTGFLGMVLIARLLEADDGPDIVVAVRAGDEAEADARLNDVLARLYDDPPASAHRLRAIRADLTEPGLGLSALDRRALASEVDRIVHCAASISFTLPLEEARAVNVAGTRTMLDLARELPRLERFVHVSTAFVSGRLPGTFGEADVGGAHFRNTYEQTKMEAELAVRAASDLPTVIIRPSIVVGESDSGWTSAFNVIYWPVAALARGLLDTVPADPTGLLDVVPVDYVAEVIERAAFLPGVRGTFHAVAAEHALRVTDLIDHVCKEFDQPRPQVSAPSALAAGHPAQVFAPYFDVQTIFDDRRAQLLTSDYGRVPPPATYLPRILDYGKRVRWGKRPLTRQAARRSLHASGERGPRRPGEVRLGRPL